LPHEHYYTPNPSSEIVEKRFEYKINESLLSFVSVSGVFGFSPYVDKASDILIRNFTPSGATLLDLGCGFGSIGLSLKHKYPELSVTMTDINSRAIEYSLKNASNNRLNTNIILSDLFLSIPDEKFNDILSNPPIAMGKSFLKDLINDSYNHLLPGGSLWLVAFHNKGGASIKNLMIECFGNAIDVKKSGGIRVYKSCR